MNALRLPGPILQCFAALRRAFGRPRRPGASTGDRLVAVMDVDHGAPAASAERATPEDFADAAAEPAVKPRLRTLEEVRADLAHLRERTRALQAQAQARRDMSFAPTDFMDFAEVKPAPAESPPSGFAPTDFLDFGMPNLQPGR